MKYQLGQFMIRPHQGHFDIKTLQSIFCLPVRVHRETIEPIKKLSCMALKKRFKENRENCSLQGNFR